MSMIISHNLPALGAHNFVGQTTGALQKTIRRLSTGLHINSASDDAAGLAISERRRSQIAGADRAAANIQDGISMMQTAEGALNETHSILQRMRELSLQAANDTLTQEDRGHIQDEIVQLRDEVTRIANTTQFNRKKLLNGDAAVISGSSDTKTRAIITGGLRARDPFSQVTLSEGNYNIKVESAAGRAQVQKTNIFKIKHEDALAAVNLDEDSLKDVDVHGMPAGTYTVRTETLGKAALAVTGAYGLSSVEVSKYIEAGAETENLEKNASILFEVTEKSGSSVTLKAKANILSVDGTAERIERTVTLPQGNSAWVDLSSTFGLGKAGKKDNKADGAFEMRLQSASGLSVGDKFVYNLTAAQGVTSDAGTADRTVSISGAVNEEWPDAWEQRLEIQASKILGFPPSDSSGAAKVLFIIDNSGSMGTPITTVKNNIKGFVQAIQDQGVEDVQIGVARYGDHLLDRAGSKSQSAYGGVTTQWGSTATELDALLLGGLTEGGGVSPYDAIIEALEGNETLSITKYDMSDVEVRHIVLITDTYDEAHSGKLNAAKAALTKYNVTLSAVSAGTNDITDLISEGGEDFTITDTDATTGWGSKLINTLGTKIGKQAAKTPSSDTPLSDVYELQALFTGSGEARTLTVHQGENSETITIAQTATLNDLVGDLKDAIQKFDATADVHYVADASQGRPGTIVITTEIPGKAGRITFSGDDALIEALGFRDESTKDLSYVTDQDLKFSLDADKVTDTTIHFRNFYINSSDGTVYEGDITLTTGPDELPADSSLGSFDAAYVTQIAGGGTKLRDLEQFWDASGNFLLEDPQTLTITQGDGQQASITLYATDTLSTVTEKLNAVIGDTFGQAKYMDKDGRDKFATFVDEADVNSEAVRGTLLIRSAVPGAAGRLNFSGSEGLLNALGLNTIQDAAESVYRVTVTDAHTGDVVNGIEGVKVTGSRLVGALHPNIDVEFDAMSGITAAWNDKTKQFDLKSGSRTTTLHLADNTTTFQAGVNQGEDMSIHIGDMRAHALGLDRVLVTDRESAARSVTLIDNAIDTVSMQRARIGAYQSRLEHAVSKLTAASENLTAAEGRVRDADMAKEMMEFTKLQILLQSGNSMLAQANQYPQAVLNLIR